MSAVADRTIRLTRDGFSELETELARLEGSCPLPPPPWLGAGPRRVGPTQALLQADKPLDDRDGAHRGEPTDPSTRS